MKALIFILVPMCVLGFACAAHAQESTWYRAANYAPGELALVFQDRLWLLPPWSGIPASSSSDGRNFREEAVLHVDDYSCQFGDYTRAAVCMEKMWVLGVSYNGSPPAYTLKYSDHGTEWLYPGQDGQGGWMCEIGEAPPVYGTPLMAFDDSLWLIGGQGFCPYDKDSVQDENPEGEFSEGEPCLADAHTVYRSADGIGWWDGRYKAPWGNRVWHTAVVFHERLWILGGHDNTYPLTYLNDVWSSADGITWRQETAAAPWSPRAFHACAVHDGALWLLGGETDDKTLLADVWRSTDGIEWTLQTSAAPWGPRKQMQAVSFNEELLVIHGTSTTTRCGDMWAYGRAGAADAHLHSADTNADGGLSLSELLRLIQLFNAGGYACGCGGEDGFTPSAGHVLCPPHQSDYGPQDWRIDLNELLRAIQFYNVGGYHACPGTGSEDGFCPGSLPGT